MVDDALAGRALSYLRLLVRDGRLELDECETAAARIATATCVADVEEVVRDAPKMWIESAPDTAAPNARIVSRLRGLRLRGHEWSLAAETEIAAGAANLVLDLSQAHFGSPIVDLTITTGVNKVTVLVPDWVDVVVQEESGSLASHMPTLPRLPGLPLVRLRVRGGLGRVIVRPAGSRVWFKRLSGRRRH